MHSMHPGVDPFILALNLLHVDILKRDEFSTRHVDRSVSLFKRNVAKQRLKLSLIIGNHVEKHYLSADSIESLDPEQNRPIDLSTSLTLINELGSNRSHQS